MEYPQIYKLSPAEARTRGETDLFRASHRLNIACRNAIEETIRKNFDGMHLKKECIRPVMEEYGPDRMDWVLANTVRYLEHDGRFSHSNKKWAGGFGIPEAGTRGCGQGTDFIVGSHPAILDMFISLMRKEREAAKAQPEKPSVIGQLAAAPAAGKNPAAVTKDREVR